MNAHVSSILLDVRDLHDVLDHHRHPTLHSIMQRVVEHSRRLWGAIEAEEERTFLGHWSADRQEYARQILKPKSADFERGFAAGRQLTFEEAVG